MYKLKVEYSNHALALIEPILKNGEPPVRHDPIAKAAKRVLGRAARVATRLTKVEMAK